MGGEYRSLRYLACCGGVGGPGRWSAVGYTVVQTGAAVPWGPVGLPSWVGRSNSERCPAQPSGAGSPLWVSLWPAVPQLGGCAGRAPSKSGVRLPSWQRQCRGPGPAAHEPEGWSVGRRSFEYNRWTSIPESAAKPEEEATGCRRWPSVPVRPGVGPRQAPGWSFMRSWPSLRQSAGAEVVI
jgi:hypothetical protein